jgi:formylglycine-generating enzyme required for sulfatase activity
MSTVPQWSGREVRALRAARRMSVREFAAHLGVSDRMVSKWEAAGEAMRPRPHNQAALDTSLAMANFEARTRFGQLATGRVVQVESVGPSSGVRHVARHPVDGKLMTLVEAGVYTPARPESASGERSESARERGSNVTHGKAGWLEAYYIDVFPTTSGDYAQFVSMTGHRAPAQWPGGTYTGALAESLIQVAWVDAQAYAAWASKSLPTAIQWERAADGDEGLVTGHLPEWCASVRGPRRHEARTHGKTNGYPAFRCVVAAGELLALLAI